jgi:hypothetical protein
MAIDGAEAVPTKTPRNIQTRLATFGAVLLIIPFIFLLWPAILIGVGLQRLITALRLWSRK